MLERLTGTRVRAVLRKSRRIYWRTRMEQEVEALASAGAEARVLRKAELRHKLRMWCIRIVDHERDRHLRRCLVVRNKWQLAWRLMQQPALARSRADARLKAQLRENAIKLGSKASHAMLSPKGSEHGSSRGLTVLETAAAVANS